MKERKDGYVYLIAYPNNHFKIGFSSSVKRRLSQLQSMSIEKLYLYKTIFSSDKRLTEKILHEHFGKYKIRKGEFFLITDEQILKELLMMMESLETH